VRTSALDISISYAVPGVESLRPTSPRAAGPSVWRGRLPSSAPVAGSLRARRNPDSKNPRSDSGAPVGGRGSKPHPAPSTPGQGSQRCSVRAFCAGAPIPAKCEFRLSLRWPRWRGGREVRQRPAKPRTPVRIRSAPLLRQARTARGDGSHFASSPSGASQNTSAPTSGSNPTCDKKAVTRRPVAFSTASRK
jgi:hypothetical protein